MKIVWAKFFLGSVIGFALVVLLYQKQNNLLNIVSPQAAGNISVSIDGCVRYRNSGDTKIDGRERRKSVKVLASLAECIAADKGISVPIRAQLRLIRVASSGAESGQGVCQVSCGIYQVDIRALLRRMIVIGM
jgi:hypothetical protein